MDLQQDAIAERSFHARLLQIDGDLHSEDIHAIKFLCKDSLPKSKLAKVASGHELFLSMETTKLITSRDQWLLVEVFKTIGRQDLIDYLDIDETQLKTFTTTHKISDYRHLLFDIAQDLTREDTQKLSFLADKISKSKREKLASALDLFSLLEESKLVTPGNLDKLLEYLTVLNRNDLAERIHHLEYKTCEPTVLAADKQNPGVEKGQEVASQTTQRTQNGIPESLRLELSKELCKLTDDKLQSFWADLGYTEEYVQRLAEQLKHQEREQKVLVMLNCAPLLHEEMSMALPRLINAMRFSDLLHLSRQIIAAFKDRLPHLPKEYLRDAEMHQHPMDNRNMPVSTEEAVQAAVTTGSNNECATVGLEQDKESMLPMYKMDANPRGVCIIINNQHFWTSDDPSSERLSERIGSSIDAGKLKTTFEGLHFEVVVYDDVPATDMLRLLDTTGREHIRSQHDCFVCCILTHGKNNQIYGSDGRLVDFTDVMAPFKAVRCQQLAGKPKLFFMQACQGKERQEGIEVSADMRMEEDGVVPEVVPNEADFLLGFATAPGYVSYRSKSQGSWYIGVLTELLDKLAHEHDLLSILTKVNHEVGKKQDDRDGKKFKQSPAPQYTLRKRVIFKKIAPNPVQ